MNADWRLPQQPVLLAFAFTQPHNYSAAQHLVSRAGAWAVESSVLRLRRGKILQVLVYELLRIALLSTWVNRCNRPSSSNSSLWLSEVSPLRSNASLVLYSSGTLHQTCAPNTALHAR